MKIFNLHKELVKGQFWFISLRWIAVAGVFATVMVLEHVLRVPLQAAPLYGIAAVMGVYNAAFLYLLTRSQGGLSPANIDRMASVQIGMDLVVLAALIHFSGGIENPFIFYFIFHMILAGILLSRRAAFLQATLATVLFSCVVGLEYAGVIPHYCLKGFILQCQGSNPSYVLGVSLVFISTLYIAVYFTTVISAELRKREQVLEEANELLKERDRIKSEYVLRVSHDIKSDLATVKTCLEPVVSGLCGDLAPDQLNLLERAFRRTGKLLFFIQALLRITKMKLLKELEMEHFSIEDVLTDAIAVVTLHAEEKNIPVEVVVDIAAKDICGVKEYIFEALQNVLANAVKYTPPSGKVKVNVSGTEDSILVRIADTGIGIPKADLPRIFEEFFRASNAKIIEKDGTGLGLSIVRQVMDLHGGDVWIESEEGKGTQISMRLPRKRNDQEGAPKT